MKGSRFLKQFIYGAGFLAFWALIITLVYFVWLKPTPTCSDNIQNQGETGVDCGGPCEPCELKNLVPLGSTWVKYFPAGSETAIVTQINNTNIKWGADSFTYSIDIFGASSTRIQTITGTSFIYSGEIKYIFELAKIDSKKISGVEISLSNPNWKNEADFPRPDASTRGLKTEAGSNGIIVSGFIQNNNAYDLSKVNIIGFLENSKGIQIGVSKTQLENILSFTEKEFKINFPKGFSLINTATSTKKSSPLSNFSQADPARTEVYVEVLR